MNFDIILENVRLYYEEKIEICGATPWGVDWNSSEFQELRFKQLLTLYSHTGNFSINDYGCGYGALVKYMVSQGYMFCYHGFDISDRMIAQARALYNGWKHCEFFTDECRLNPADYTVASGIFNVKLQTSDREWEKYVFHTLEKIAELSKKGFAFNMITSCPERDRIRSELYYADPCSWLGFCKTRFSDHVSLLHDYGLYEFTLVVRKNYFS
jgi:hypothetical protein